MLQILIASPDRTFLSELSSRMENGQAEITRTGSGGKAFSNVQQQAFDLFIADEDLGDMTGLACIEKIVFMNPMLNCAVVSALSEENFHEASEGLGILMPLPKHPGQTETEKLLERLKSILDLNKNSG